MRILLCTLMVAAALLALLGESMAQEAEPNEEAVQEAAQESAPPAESSSQETAPEDPERGDQLAAPQARLANFAARASAVRGERLSSALGALVHAERAKEHHGRLVSEGQVEAAARAERIALRALELAEMIVRRERARARIQALQRERAQIAYRMEQARSVLEHQVSLPAEFPPDPNVETDESSEAP